MYESTVNKALTPSNENFRVDPPTYEVTPVTSAHDPTSGLASQTPSIQQSPHGSSISEGFPFPIQTPADGESCALWENTILANIHRLPDLTKTDNSTKDKLIIKIQFTEKIGQIGVEPTLIDPSKHEYRQGDFLHGYVRITNISDKPIPFDMFYVVFEGAIIHLKSENGILDTTTPQTVYKHLSMLDLFASWLYSNIDRLVTDNGNPHDWCEGEHDPVDNTELSINVQREFEPHITYKRFFTFRVPQSLLDDTCDMHNLTKHTEVPPSIGVPRNLIPPSVLLAQKQLQIRDLSFVDTSLGYSVDARVIGKGSEYDFSPASNSYVIAAHDSCPIRIIPDPHPENYYNRNDVLRESRLFYRAFVDSVSAKIQEGHELRAVPRGQREDFVALSPAPSRESAAETASKLRQLYKAAGSTIKKNVISSRKAFQDEMCQCMVPFKKKSLTGASRVQGIVSLATPREEYRAFYVPPGAFQDDFIPFDPKYNHITIPLELSYFMEMGTSLSGKPTMPEIKSIAAELVVLSIRTPKDHIPVEINHDMCFRDQQIDSKKMPPENFNNIVIQPFQKFLKEATSLIKELGSDGYRFETQMYRDIRSLAKLQTKYINLVVPDTEHRFSTKSSTSTGLYRSLKDISWTKEETVKDGILYSKNFDLTFDLAKSQLKGESDDHKKRFDNLTLVPSFQTCLFLRVYYLRITVKLVSGDPLVVHAPVTIEKFQSD